MSSDDERICSVLITILMTDSAKRLRPGHELFCFWRNLRMLILSLIGFLVIMEALNQAYEGGNEDGDV